VGGVEHSSTRPAALAGIQESFMSSTLTLTNKQISALNTFLRGEMSAVETYNQALEQSITDQDGSLAENRDCHARRVSFLHDKITSAGGEPDSSSGTWGNFAAMVEKGASLISQQMVLNALEEGEDHGLKMYRNSDEDDETLSEMVHVHLLPAQIGTHERMRRLKAAGAQDR